MKGKKSTAPTQGSYQPIALAEIEPNPANPRQHFDKAKLKELADSIAQNGVLQPILVRPHEPTESSVIRFRLIAGERRYRAAQMAGLTVIPATIWSREEADTLDLALIENLQREDVHPLDEALGFQRMKEGLQLDLKTLAQRLGKDARYIARRLALTDLIAEAKRDFHQELITLAHALELCRLAPGIQAEALAACYESKMNWDEEQEANVTVPDKEQPVRHVRYLQEWIARNVHLNLTAAPFALDDESLRSDGLTCLTCPNRSGYNKTLFADIKEKDTCLNPACYQDKLQTFVQLQKNALEAKIGQSVMYCSTYYGQRYQAAAVLSRDAYQPLPKRVDRCRYAEQAIVIDGSEIGRIQWICREPACQVHQRQGAMSLSQAKGSATSSLVDRSQRRQEIFDLKVDEAVRLRVMQEALPTYTWPPDSSYLKRIALALYQRTPASDRKTICHVLGWEEDNPRPLQPDQAPLVDKLSQMDDHQLAQFLILCTIAPYGANPARYQRVAQSDILTLCQERELNHTLIEAEVRLALCPKKYKERHQNYLALVKQGQSAVKPTISERIAPVTATPTPAPLTKQASA